MRFRHLLVAGVLLAATFLLGMVLNARGEPVVRQATIVLPGWPAGAKPVRVVLWSDLHLGNLATDGARLARIVEQVNALRPDLVLLAGDMVAEYRPEAPGHAIGLVAPLSRLRARDGVIAVLGNHDHGSDPAVVRAALQRAGVRVLANTAVRVGPLVVGGLDDPASGHARPDRVRTALRRVGGVPVLLSHSPEVPGGWRGLVLAGHTHCGQVVLPIVGAPVQVTDPRYRCGIVRGPERVTVVGAGTGASDVPLRLGAPPELWVLTLGG
jgi:uncharacterized protein